MAEALAGGLFQFNVESMDEARTLSAVATAQGRVAPMGFRINPDVSAGTHAKITTGTADNKFGVPAADALAFMRRPRCFRVSPCTGSPSTSAASSSASTRWNRPSAG
jgi:diaminopimelate decarboxylase